MPLAGHTAHLAGLYKSSVYLSLSDGDVRWRGRILPKGSRNWIAALGFWYGFKSIDYPLPLVRSPFLGEGSGCHPSANTNGGCKVNQPFGSGRAVAARPAQSLVRRQNPLGVEREAWVYLLCGWRGQLSISDLFL